MKKKQTNPFQFTLTRITRTMYFLLGFFALSIALFDSGNLITREAVIDRWILCSALLAVNTLFWYLAVRDDAKIKASKLMITGLAVATLVFAGFMTYWERGMASTSTILYVLPLIIIATLKNRHALIAVATLSASTYSLAAVKYFNDFFNEGFRIQLYSSIVLYSGIIFVVAWLLMIASNLRHDSK